MPCAWCSRVLADAKGFVSLFKGKNATENLGILPSQISSIERLIGRDSGGSQRERDKVSAPRIKR